MAKELFGAILHYKWKAGSKSNEVVGKWAEDLTEYTMIVPEQLRDQIIRMQNKESDKYYGIG